MAWVRNLVRSGDSIVVTVPRSVARRWQKAGAVAVLWELDGNVLRATPFNLVEHHYRPVTIPPEEDAHAGPDDQP